MNFFIRSIIGIFFLMMFLFESLFAGKDCLSKYHCEYDMNGTKFKGIKNCRLPTMLTFPITAPNVLKSDGTPKKYFETNNTVCDVLGLDE